MSGRDGIAVNALWPRTVIATDAINMIPGVKLAQCRRPEIMADGYARETGKIGVCIATSGPGATNLISAIADAYMDSVPLLAITGQVGSKLIGTDAFQEADIVGITAPITSSGRIIASSSIRQSAVKPRPPPLVRVVA